MKDLAHHLIEQAAARITRRQFIGTTAALSTGLALSSGQALAQGTSVLRARSNSDPSLIAGGSSSARPR